MRTEAIDDGLRVARGGDDRVALGQRAFDDESPEATRRAGVETVGLIEFCLCLEEQTSACG
jgi:hypothetical protein